MLIELQNKFALMTAQLINKANELGYQVSLGEAYRTPEQAALNAKNGKGIKKSLHTDRLAIDINLFKNGQYLALADDHRPLGEWWESLDVNCRWGGNFKDSQGNPKPDGNHYSMTPDGKRA